MKKKETGKHDDEFFRWVLELIRDRSVHPARIAMETGASVFTVLRWRQRPQGRVNPQYRRIVGEMHAAAGGSPPAVDRGSREQ